MAKERKTGLGSSLLLQRTGEEDESERPDASDTQTSQASEESEHPAASPSKRPRRENAQPHRAVPRDRCTLYLDQDVNRRLDLAARIEGRERSEIASELLREHLPSYRIEQDD